MAELPNPASSMSNDLLERVAGAPITWGVDGSPGWGHLMDRDRVLAEMVDVGLAATELGPDGYLPTDPGELREYLSSLRSHDRRRFRARPPVPARPDRLGTRIRDSGPRGNCLRPDRRLSCSGPSTDHAGYDLSSEMTEDDWPLFLAGLDRLQEITADDGLATAVHPHWGMAIERPHHIDRLLESSSVGLVPRHRSRLPRRWRCGRGRPAGARAGSSMSISRM